MLQLNRIIGVVAVAFSALLLSCSQGERSDSSTELSVEKLAASPDEIGSRVAVYKLNVPADRLERSKHSAQAAFKLLMTDIASVAPGFAQDSVTKSLFTIGGADEAVAGTYDEVTDKLLLINRAVAHDRSNHTDVGEERAQNVLREVLNRLAQQGVVDPSAGRQNHAPSRIVREAAGIAGGPVGQKLLEDRVKEYIYSVPYHIGGIIINDGRHLDLGVNIGIHRTGRVSSIQVRRPDLLSKGNWQQSGTVTRTVLRQSLLEDAARRFPNATVKALGLRYSSPDDGESIQELRPHEVLWISMKTVEPDGSTLNSRASLYYYPIDDAAAEPRMWPTPNPDERSATPRR